MPRVETRESENDKYSKQTNQHKTCINYLVSQCVVMNNESLYHDMQNDEVMCQTIQGYTYVSYHICTFCIYLHAIYLCIVCVCYL